MAADIILYDAHFVPVGKDQLQHIEMTRDIAGAFNHRYGEVFVLPQPLTDESVMIVPGTDGQKMSKSYNNFINIFLPDKELLKVVKSIVTDSKQLEEPKDPNTCNVFNLYKLIATKEQTGEIAGKYRNGGFGYGHAKQALYDVIVDRFKSEREKFNYLMNNPTEIELELEKGESRAREIARKKLDLVREKLGY
jgi:tryptophanyl-tRNA synthetase